MKAVWSKNNTSYNIIQLSAYQLVYISGDIAGTLHSPDGLGNLFWVWAYLTWATCPADCGRGHCPRFGEPCHPLFGVDGLMWAVCGCHLWLLFCDYNQCTDVEKQAPCLARLEIWRHPEVARWLSFGERKQRMNYMNKWLRMKSQHVRIVEMIAPDLDQSPSEYCFLTIGLL